METDKNKSPMVEIYGARVWNIVNEGRSFYLTASLAIILVTALITDPKAITTTAFIKALLMTTPLIYIFTKYDHPLHLRYILWAYLIISVPLIGITSQTMTASIIFVAYYFFFTCVVWGAIYYLLLLKEPIKTAIRFPLLVLENSDSTSGNFLEQMPKNLFTLIFFFAILDTKITPAPYLASMIAIAAVTIIAHRQFFKKIDSATEPSVNLKTKTMKDKEKTDPAKRYYLIVIDGCNLDQFNRAKTPNMDKLIEEGTVYEKMKTLYPARTVVCFSSMLSGQPKEKTGIKSNLVMKPHRLPVETIFDVLKENKKKGKMIAIAHLLDVFPDETFSVCSLMPNATADTTIFEISKETVRKEDPDLLVTQLISVDQTGHARGCFTEDYVKAIENVDQLIGDFLEHLKKEGKLKDAVIHIMADHGQSKGIGGHGHWDDGEKYVPFILWGKNVEKGKKITSEHNILSVKNIIRNSMNI